MYLYLFFLNIQQTNTTLNQLDFREVPEETFDEVNPMTLTIPDNNRNFDVPAPVSPHSPHSPTFKWNLNENYPEFAPLLHINKQDQTTIVLEDDDAAISAATQLLPATSTEQDPQSPQSVGSGGSYLGGSVLYKQMTPQGLSPIDKNCPDHFLNHILNSSLPPDVSLPNNTNTGESTDIAMYSKASVSHEEEISRDSENPSGQNFPAALSNRSRSSSQDNIDNYTQAGSGSPGMPRMAENAPSQIQSQDLELGLHTPSGRTSRASSQESNLNNIDPYVQQSCALIDTQTTISHKRTHSDDLSHAHFNVPSMQSGTPKSSRTIASSQESGLSNIDPYVKQSGVLLGTPQMNSHRRTGSLNISRHHLDASSQSVGSSRASSLASGISNIDPYVKQSSVLPGTPQMNSLRRTGTPNLAHHQDASTESMSRSRASSLESGISNIGPYVKHSGVLVGTPQMNSHRRTGSPNYLDVPTVSVSNSRASSQDSINSNDPYVKQLPGTPKINSHRRTGSPNLLGRHLDVPAVPSGSNSRASSQESVDAYVKQSRVLPGIPKLNTHSSTSSHDLSQHHLDALSGLDSRASSQESGIGNVDPYVKCSEVPQLLPNMNSTGQNLSRSSLEDGQSQLNNDNQITNYVQSAQPTPSITANPLSSTGTEKLFQRQDAISLGRESPVPDCLRWNEVPENTMMTNRHGDDDKIMGRAGEQISAISSQDVNLPVSIGHNGRNIDSDQSHTTSEASASISLLKPSKVSPACSLSSSMESGYSSMARSVDEPCETDKTSVSDVSFDESSSNLDIPTIDTDIIGSKSGAHSTKRMPDMSERNKHGKPPLQRQVGSDIEMGEIQPSYKESDDGYASSQANSTPPESPIQVLPNTALDYVTR